MVFFNKLASKLADFCQITVVYTLKGDFLVIYYVFRNTLPKGGWWKDKICSRYKLESGKYLLVASFEISKVVFLGCPKNYFSRLVHRNLKEIFLCLVPNEVLLSYCTLALYSGLLFGRKLPISNANCTQKNPFAFSFRRPSICKNSY